MYVKKFSKKALSMFVALAMCLSMVSIPAFAAETYEVGTEVTLVCDVSGIGDHDQHIHSWSVEGSYTLVAGGKSGDWSALVGGNYGDNYITITRNTPGQVTVRCSGT